MKTTSSGLTPTTPRRLLLAAAMVLSIRAFGQGTVYFTNLGLGSDVVMGHPITVGTTTYAVGSKAPPGTIFSVALYWSPYDPANPDRPTASFGQVGLTGQLALPGIYALGTVTIPRITPPGGSAWLQVKGWETACGSSFEQVGAGLFGASAISLVQTGDPTTGGSPGRLSGIGPIVLNGDPTPCVAEPSSALLGFLGAAVLFCLRAETRSRQPGRPENVPSPRG